MKTYLLLVTGALLCIPTLSTAGHLHPEKYYQQQWCSEHGGEREVILDDGARVDCLTNEYAVEFDFAPKWAESIGQALYYGLKTGKTPGVVLIMENDGDDRYSARLQAVGKQYGLKIWELKP